MFIVDPNPTFTHNVKVQVPVDGGHKAQDFKATFAVLPVDEVKNYDLSQGAGSTEFLRRVVVGMSDLVGKNEEPVSYNNEIRDLLLGQAYVRAALTRTYFEAVSGQAAGN